MKNVYECRNPNCDNTVERYPSQVRSEAGVYCSKECKGAHQSESMKGEANPNYKDGSTLDTVCECGNEKDCRSQKCAVCSGRGFRIRQIEYPEDLKNAFKLMTDDLAKQAKINEDSFKVLSAPFAGMGKKMSESMAKSLSAELSKAMGGMSTSFSERMKVDLAEFNKAILAAKTFKDAGQMLSISQRDIAKAVKLLNVDVSHMRPAKGRVATPENVFVRTDSRSNIVKSFALDNGLLENVCSWCGQGPEWNEKPLTLELDHIDGDSRNNALDNLRILCPNCHTQTETFRGKRRE